MTTTTRIMSRSHKRARRSPSANATLTSVGTRGRRSPSATATLTSTITLADVSSCGEDDAPAVASALRLPTELIYTILAIAIGDYIGDMMLFPSKILHWDAILTLLHVSRTFRGCTIKLLYHLWGDTFIRERTRYVHPIPPFPPLSPLFRCSLYIG